MAALAQVPELPETLLFRESGISLVETPWRNSAQLSRFLDERFPSSRISDRRADPGSRRLSLGLQLHHSCVRQAPILSRLEWIDIAVHRATEGILACHSRYPEIAPLMEQWVTKMRRTKVFCPEANSNALGFGGQIFVHRVLAFNRALTPLENRELLELQPSTENPVILVGRDLFDDEMLRIAFSNLLSHEIFHATTANNRDEHNLYMLRDGFLTDSCTGPRSRLEDRIYFLEHLCSSQPNVSIPEIVRIKSKNCGIQTGCVDLFSPRGNTQILFAPFLPSSSMSEPSARSFCERLRDDGYCLNERRERLAEDSGSEQALELNQSWDEIRRNWLLGIPARRAGYSRFFLDRFPELRAQLMSFSSHQCFSRHLESTVEGVFLKPEFVTNRLRDSLYKPSLVSERIDQVLNQNPGCRDGNEVFAFRRTLEQIGNAAEYIFERNPFIDSLRTVPIYANSRFRYPSINSFFGGGPLSGNPLSSYFGGSLMRRYESLRRDLIRSRERCLDPRLQRPRSGGRGGSLSALQLEAIQAEANSFRESGGNRRPCANR